jgi:hypothetical protein
MALAATPEDVFSQWSAGVSPASCLEISVASPRGKAMKRARRPRSNVLSYYADSPSADVQAHIKSVEVHRFYSGSTAPTMIDYHRIRVFHRKTSVFRVNINNY